jgi:hypothetical protein
MAEKAAPKARKKRVNKPVKKAAKMGTKRLAAKKSNKKARPRKKGGVSKKARTARLIGTVAGRFAWSVLVSVLSSATGLPTSTFQLKDQIAKYGFYDAPSKSRLAQLLRDRHVDIDDGAITGAETVGDVEKAITGKLPEKTETV